MGELKLIVFAKSAEHHGNLCLLKAQILWTYLTPAELEFPENPGNMHF